MTQLRLRDKGIAMQLIIFGAIILMSTLIFTIITQLLPSSILPDIADKSLKALKAGAPETITYFKVVQLITSLAIFIFPPLLFAHFYDRNIIRFFGFQKSLKWDLFLCALILMPISVPIINTTQILNQSLHFPSFLSGLEKNLRLQDAEYTVFQDAFLKGTSINGLIFNIILMAVIPAIGEEMFFRGMVQKFFSKHIQNFHISIIITAVIFSAIHFQFFSFLPRFILGMFFGYIFYWSGNLLYPIIAHFINNALAVFVTFLVNSKHLPSDPTTSPDNMISWTQTVISILLIMLIMRVFKGNYKMN